MRLIDADEIPFRKEFGDMSDNPKMFVFKSDVDKIPTIDPASLRPKGEWKWYDHTISFWYIERGYMCSVCGSKQEDETHFCPNCGADMRGETHDS